MLSLTPVTHSEPAQNIGFGREPNTQSDLQSNGEMRRGAGEQGGERETLQRAWKRLDWALITLSGNEDLVGPIVPLASFVRLRLCRDAEESAEEHVDEHPVLLPFLSS